MALLASPEPEKIEQKPEIDWDARKDDLARMVSHARKDKKGLWKSFRRCDGEENLYYMHSVFLYSFWACCL